MKGKISFDSDRQRKDCLVNYKGIVGPNPEKAGKIKIYDFDTRQCDMQFRPLVHNRRVKRIQCFSIESLFCSNISSGGSLENSWPTGVCMYVCPSVQVFSPLEPERLVGSGRANMHSMRRNGGKTMVTVSHRSVGRDTCHVRSHKPLQKKL